MTDQAKLALVSFDSLGDSLIYLMMAENLRTNGYQLTYYSTVAYQLKDWVPKLNIRPYPPLNGWDEELNQYDLVIMSPTSYLRRQMTDDVIVKMREKWLLICQKAPKNWRYDHTERLKRALSPDRFESIRNLANCSGSIRYKKYYQENVVEITKRYMENKMLLKNVSHFVELKPPEHLHYRRFSKRIIVSPDSAGPDSKNWSEKGFIRLCHELKGKGYDPQIVVAPQHHKVWKAMRENVFDTPIFSDINSLASYLYESGALIANDSGNGHLASFLGIPVVTIYRKRNKKFHWRPGWKEGKVVCPMISLPWLGGRRIWKSFVRPGAIINALEEVL